jgi:chitinase
MKSAKRFLPSVHNAMLMTIIIFFFIIQVHAGKIVVGYYPSWIRSTLPTGNIKFEHLTHINHAFAWPDSNGNILMYNDLIYPELNQLAHQNNVKISISLGGWGNSSGFSPMVADSVKRAFFIDNLVNFLNTNNYDGVDFDWEFPNTTNDRNNLTKLITEVRDRFNLENPNWLITFAVGTSNWKGQWYDYTQLVNYVDLFNAMCYDFHGSWSIHSGHNAPLYQPPGCTDGAINVGMTYLHNTRGIPKNQLTVGMPFYGKEFNSSVLYSPFTNPVTDYLYSQIVPKMNGSWTYHWDNVSKVPYLTNSTNTKLITFDDTVSIRYKCEWIKTQDYAGGMIWALGQDAYNNEQVLLETIGNHLLDSAATTIIANVTPPSEYIFHDNYPNPFNPFTTITFVLPFKAGVQIDIYNAAGELVQKLLNEQKNTGRYKIKFNAVNLPSGMYFYYLKIDNESIYPVHLSGKMLLLK